MHKKARISKQGDPEHAPSPLSWLPVARSVATAPYETSTTAYVPLASPTRPPSSPSLTSCSVGRGLSSAITSPIARNWLDPNPAHPSNISQRPLDKNERIYAYARAAQRGKRCETRPVPRRRDGSGLRGGTKGRVYRQGGQTTRAEGAGMSCQPATQMANPPLRWG